MSFPQMSGNMAYTTPRGVYGTGAFMKPPKALPQTFHAPMQQHFYPMDMQHMAYEAVRLIYQGFIHKKLNNRLLFL